LLISFNICAWAENEKHNDTAMQSRSLGKGFMCQILMSKDSKRVVEQGADNIL